MQATTLLGLRAAAPIHAGSDDARGAVDLPIQREKHNNWPVVFASSVKGALREMCSKPQTGAPPTDAAKTHGTINVNALFGAPDSADQAQSNPAKQGMQAGALLVSDMQLLALPVASLDRAYRWVTCPSALARLARNWVRFGMTTPACPALPAPFDSDIAYHFDTDLPSEKCLFLREYRFTARHVSTSGDANLASWLSLLAQLFASHTQEKELRERLLIISDQRFGFLAETATSVAPHIRLDENKTTVDGAMFYEETLPPETLMYLPLACVDERKTETPATATQLMQQLLKRFADTRYFLRVGGNETTGMGWFEVHVCKEQP